MAPKLSARPADEHVLAKMRGTSQTKAFAYADTTVRNADTGPTSRMDILSGDKTRGVDMLLTVRHNLAQRELGKKNRFVLHIRRPGQTCGKPARQRVFEPCHSGLHALDLDKGRARIMPFEWLGQNESKLLEEVDALQVATGIRTEVVGEAYDAPSLDPAIDDCTSEDNRGRDPVIDRAKIQNNLVVCSIV